MDNASDVPAETWISVGGGGETAVAQREAPAKSAPEIDLLIRKLRNTLDRENAVASARLAMSLGAWGERAVASAARGGDDEIRSVLGELCADVRSRKLEVATDAKSGARLQPSSSLLDPARAGLVRRIKDVLGKQVRTQTQYETAVADSIVRAVERLRVGRENISAFRDREMSDVKSVEARWSDRLGELVDAAARTTEDGPPASTILSGGGSTSVSPPPPTDPEIVDLGRRIRELSAQIDTLRAERLALWDDAGGDTADLIARARDMDTRIGDLAKQRMGLADVRRRRVGRSLEEGSGALSGSDDASEAGFSVPLRTTNENAVHRRWRLEDTLGRSVGEMVAEIGDASDRAGRDLERMVVATYGDRASAAQATCDALTTALTDDLDLLRADLPRSQTSHSPTSFKYAAREAQIDLRCGVLEARESLLGRLEAALGPRV